MKCRMCLHVNAGLYSLPRHLLVSLWWRSRSPLLLLLTLLTLLLFSVPQPAAGLEDD